MARVLRGVVLVLAIAVVASTSHAQEPAGADEVRVVRPPEGSLRRGRLAVPDFAVYAVGGTLTALAAGALIVRSWRSGRRRRRKGPGART